MSVGCGAPGRDHHHRRVGAVMDLTVVVMLGTKEVGRHHAVGVAPDQATLTVQLDPFDVARLIAPLVDREVSRELERRLQTGELERCLQTVKTQG